MIWVYLISFSPVYGALIWHLYEVFAPRFLPEEDIAAEARQRIERDGERALYVLALDQDRAWRHSETYDQFRLQRVGRTIAALQDRPRPAKG